jgi:hypothetical protein
MGFEACTSFSGSHYISDSSATVLTSSLLTHIVDGNLNILYNDALATISLGSLTHIGGSLGIYTHNVLTTINLPSLSAMSGDLYIFDNPSLTFAHLPKLTFIEFSIGICQNNAAFRIPSGPPDAPTGGLVVTGQYKGTPSCRLQDGASPCASRTTCP